MSRPSRTISALAAVAICGVTLGACGIPTQPSASPLSTRETQALPATPQTISPCTKGCTNVDVFFVGRESRLTPAKRVVPHDAKIRTVIDALLGGPTQVERQGGISTALTAGTRLVSVVQTTKKKTMTLNFSADFGTLSGTREVLGVAQVVYTVSAFRPGVGVIFEIAKSQLEVPVETGAFVTGAVHESQYAALLTTTAPASTP